ncbi:hypothetical protein SCHPADRAFT_935255 [Schizopora paradoxa]|uniref:DUF6533 domain-containing protein n=1 Tax=Schizopora paradoxa TaxID=27342 RepID=A0A0H2S5I0_9AGAM|nr:hypothetical protein SCHPADRAFT_935255 [Schizopora paradoxa]
MSVPSSLGSTLTKIGWQLTGLKYASLAGLTTLFYDIFLTFSDEVKFIWNGNFTIVKLNFIIVTSSSSFTRLLHVDAAPVEPLHRFWRTFLRALVWHISVLQRIYVGIVTLCNRFILLAPLLGGIILTFSINVVIYLRIYALFGRNKVVATALMIYLLAELGVGLWSFLFPKVHPYILPGPPEMAQYPVLHSCVWEHSVRLSNLQSATYQFMQTGFDTIAFVLIGLKAILDSNDQNGLRSKMAQDGFLYFVVVLSLNMTWALMIIFAPPLLRYAAAQPAIQLQCVCMNRMTLSLMSFRFSGVNSGGEDINRGIGNYSNENLKGRSGKRRGSWVGTSTFEAAFTDSDCSTLPGTPGLPLQFPTSARSGDSF